jgi:phosphoribosylformylglycinamidine synthase
MENSLVRACHDLSEGGLAVSASEMAFTGGLGLEIDISSVPIPEKMRKDFILFSESNGRLLVEISKNDCKEFEKIMNGTAHAKIGRVKKDDHLTVRDNGEILFEIHINELMRAWKTPLEEER